MSRRCKHTKFYDCATRLVCRSCGASGRYHPGLMRALRGDGKRLDGPVFAWSDGQWVGEDGELHSGPWPSGDAGNG